MENATRRIHIHAALYYGTPSSFPVKIESENIMYLLIQSDILHDVSEDICRYNNKYYISREDNYYVM